MGEYKQGTRGGKQLGENPIKKERPKGHFFSRGQPLRPVEAGSFSVPHRGEAPITPYYPVELEAHKDPLQVELEAHKVETLFSLYIHKHGEPRNGNRYSGEVIGP